MKRSHISSPRSYSRPAISIFGVFLLFLLVLTLSSRKPSDSSSGLAPNRNLATKSTIPRFAYLVTGTKGDGKRVKRLLKAIHHPRNYYLLHLDLEASDEERIELAKYVRSEKKKFENVMVMGLADLVTEKGPTMLASTLHGVAILLKKAKDWDWFINLSASDYPLMPQDGKCSIFKSFLHVLCLSLVLISSMEIHRENVLVLLSKFEIRSYDSASYMDWLMYIGSSFLCMAWLVFM